MKDKATEKMYFDWIKCKYRTNFDLHIVNKGSVINMAKCILEDGTEINVTHIMADGTIRESMKGYVVPYNENTKDAFRLIAECSGTKINTQH